MTKDERIQLENLSKITFGSKTKYKKLMDKGELSTLKRTLEDGTEQSYKGYNHYSLEEVKTKMETIFKEKLAKEKVDEEKAKEVQYKTNVEVEQKTN